MRIFKKKILGIAVLAMCAITSIIIGVSSMGTKTVKAATTIDVKYYNGGFWNAMTEGREYFSNPFDSVKYDFATDTIRLKFDYRSKTDGGLAWGKENAIEDAYCDFSQAKYIFMEIKNNLNADADFRMFFSGYENANTKSSAYEVNMGIEVGKNYYLKPKSGSTVEVTARDATGHYIIPANFDGTVIFNAYDLCKYWGDDKWSLNCIQRVNFEFTKDYSYGDLTFGKVGFNTADISNIYDINLNYIPMYNFPTADSNANDLRIFKQWVYNNNLSYFNEQLARFNNTSKAVLAENTDEIDITYENSLTNAGEILQLWCADFDSGDRNLSSYKYLVIPVRNLQNVPALFQFGLTDEVSGTRNHFAFNSAYLRLRNNSKTVLTLIENNNLCIPASFDGYVIVAMDNSDLYYSSVLGGGGASTFTKSNAMALNMFIPEKNKGYGHIAVGRPMVAKSSKILDAVNSIGTITDNDTYTKTFRVLSTSKAYDGQPFALSVSNNFAYTAKWYDMSSGSPVSIASAPINAGNYKVEISATGYQYRNEALVSVTKGNPAKYIEFVDRTFYVGETITASDITLSANSIKGQLSFDTVTLVEGSNEIDITFTPNDNNYNQVSGLVLEIIGEKPNVSINVSNKVEDGKPISVKIGDFDKPYVVNYYKKSGGVYAKMTTVPTAVGDYRVEVYCSELNYRQTADFSITAKAVENTQNNGNINIPTTDTTPTVDTTVEQPKKVSGDFIFVMCFAGGCVLLIITISIVKKIKERKVD